MYYSIQVFSLFVMGSFRALYGIYLFIYSISTMYVYAVRLLNDF